MPTAFGSFSLTCGQVMFWLQLKLVVGRRVLSVGGPQGAIVLCSGFVSQDLLGRCGLLPDFFVISEASTLATDLFN